MRSGLHKYRNLSFTTEGKHCGSDTSTARRQCWRLAVIVCLGCSPHTNVPKDSSDSQQFRSPRTTSPPLPAQPTEPSDTHAFKVGRALEQGRIDDAQSLASTLGNDTPALLVKARLAEHQHDFETAVRLYHEMTDSATAFERIRIEALAAALAEAGRPAEAASQLRLILGDKTLDGKDRFALLSRAGSWLKNAEQYREAIALYEEAESLAPKPADRDELKLELASAHLALKETKAASAILKTLALDGETGSVMTKAYAMLESNRLMPNWSATDQLKRGKKLMGFRAFEAAEAALEAAETPKTEQEVDWLKANILFKKRGHYKAANAAFNAIVAAGGPYADEARFLAARALSRLDKDAEAIRAYRAFALRTKRKERANDARFLAARLEFYLGRHKQALRSFEWLVGSGKRLRTNRLGDAGDRRDAHFLAGLSALLVNRPKEALPHLVAASDGTRHEEVLKRNQYWQAVAESMLGGKKIGEAFYEICKADPSDWYALMSAKRLRRLKLPVGVCQTDELPFLKDVLPSGTSTEPDNERPDIAAIRTLSPLAALFAEAGLFKDASRFLNDAERSGEMKPEAAEWIRHYNALDAPQFAIRRASRELRWPPTKETFALAEAAYPTPYEAVVRQVEAIHDLPSDLIFAIARKESLFDPEAVSWVGAMGMMQMMPRTYEANRKKAGLKKLEKGALPGPVESIQAAGYEFADLFEQFGGSLPLAIMAYNGGAAAVARWVSRSGGLPLDVFVEKVGFTQTRNYVKRVTKNLARYRLLQGKPVPSLPDLVSKTPAKPDA